MYKKFIQEQSNWCWAAACKMVAQQYKIDCFISKWSLDNKRTNISQESIVLNANTVRPGSCGNFPGDDDAKIRGLKYAVTGDCDSRLIDVETLGTYDMVESLLERYDKEIMEVFRNNHYMIGNAVLLPYGICHSFVLLGMQQNKIRTFDPWDGSINLYTMKEVFEEGFYSARGFGVIKWIQYIKENSCNI